MEFYSAQRRMKFCHLQVNEWNQRTSFLSEVSQVQKVKSYMFSLICKIWIPYKYKQYFETLITGRGGHIQEREGKRRKLIR
jgi:hypothetical protein